MQILFHCYSIPDDDIATMFCTCHGKAVMSCAKHLGQLELVAEQNKISIEIELQWKVVSDMDPNKEEKNRRRLRKSSWI